jgi:hypothetical protein
MEAKRSQGKEDEWLRMFWKSDNKMSVRVSEELAAERIRDEII